MKSFSGLLNLLLAIKLQDQQDQISKHLKAILVLKGTPIQLKQRVSLFRSIRGQPTDWLIGCPLLDFFFVGGFLAGGKRNALILFDAFFIVRIDYDFTFVNYDYGAVFANDVIFL